MDHSAYKEMLSALLDGELDRAACEATLAHLETCADCRAYFDELTALRVAFGTLEEFDAPEDFAAGVLARLHTGDATALPRAGETAPKPMKKRVAWRGVATLAACAAVVLLAVYTLPDALTMGGRSTTADSAANVLSAPAPAADEAAPAEAPASSAKNAAAPQAPASDPGYAYIDGGKGDDADRTALESAHEEQGRAADADLPAATNDSIANGASSSGTVNNAEQDTAIVTTSGERYDKEGVKLPVGEADETPMTPLSRPEAWGEEYPVLTLFGEGAALWLAEHGWQGESGAWYADAADLRALPDSLTVLYSELPEDYDGAVLVELWEAEP